MKNLQGGKFFYTSIDRFIYFICLFLSFFAFPGVSKAVIRNGKLFKKINLHFFIFYYIIQAKAKDFFCLVELLKIIKGNSSYKIYNRLAGEDFNGLSTKLFCFTKFLKIYLKQ